MDRYVHIRGYRVSHTDIVRLVVIASLTISCIFITSLSLTRHVETIYAQLFYFPILYATYFYPRRGLYLAGFCAVVYEVLAYVYVFPDTGGLIYTTGQAILFICIAALVAYFTEKVNTSESRYRSIFETSLLGIVLFDQNTFSIRLANSYLARLLGYSEAELASMGFSRALSCQGRTAQVLRVSRFPRGYHQFRDHICTKKRGTGLGKPLLEPDHRKPGQLFGYRYQPAETCRAGCRRKLYPVQTGDRERPDLHYHPQGE